MAAATPTDRISDEAMELLRVAQENDSHNAMAKNATLLAALAMGASLVHESKGREKSTQFPHLHERELPKNFLELVVACLRSIRFELDEQYGNQRKKPAYAGLAMVSDFDGFAQKAFAEAMADLVWPDRAAKDFDGPGLEACRAKLARVDAARFWELTIQHYVANILQYYFAAARLREKYPDLDPELEVKLRRYDAGALAMRVTAERSKQSNKSDPTAVLAALQSVMDRLISGAA